MSSRVLRRRRASPTVQDRDERAKEITQPGLSTRSRNGAMKDVEVKKGRKEVAKVAGKQMRNVVGSKEDSSLAPADSSIKKRGRPKKSTVDQKDREESSSSTLTPSAKSSIKKKPLDLKEKEESSPTTDPTDSSIKKRGRPKKSTVDQKDKDESSSSTLTPSAESSIKKKPLDLKEKEESSSSTLTLASTDSSIKKRGRPKKKPLDREDKTPPREVSAADTGRPCRERKRPSWMMNEGEEATSRQDQSDDNEVEESPIPSLRKKNKKTEQPTPVKKRDSTPDQKNPSLIGVDEKHEQLLFTPKAGKVVLDRRRAMSILKENCGISKRQDMVVLVEPEEEILIAPVNEGMTGAKRSDFPNMGIILSDHQQRLLFSGLIVHQNTERPEQKYYECMHCHKLMRRLEDGRRHMVAHLRIKRFCCGLCGAGAFFCIDMRKHLQLRGCPELSQAPQHMLMPGTPCMSREHADELSFAAHSVNPGLALFTSGKIVSILSKTPYLPDPVIEEKILGPTRMPPRGISSSPDEDIVVDVESIDEPSDDSSDPMPILPIAEEPI